MQQLVADTWIWEVSSLIFSALCLTAMVGVLKFYDQQQVPELSYGLTLNAIVSILATFCKSALIVAVASGISQLKWEWFRSSSARRRQDRSSDRSLLDLQLFEDASRGPWGSLVRLATPHTWSWVSFGALITVGALAMDTFVQQLISQPLRNYPAPSNITGLLPGLKTSSSLNGTLSTDIRAMAIQTLWDDLPTVPFSRDAICAGDSCSWPDFDSMEFCSSCRDATKDVVVTGCSLVFSNSTLVDGLRPRNQTIRKLLEMGNNCTLELANGGTNPFNFTLKADMLITPDVGEDGTLVLRKPPSLQLIYPRRIVWEASYDAALARNLLARDFGEPRYNETRPVTGATLLPATTLAQAQLYDDMRPGTEHLSVSNATACSIYACTDRYSAAFRNGQASYNTTATTYRRWDIVMASHYFRYLGWKSAAEPGSSITYNMTSVADVDQDFESQFKRDHDLFTNVGLLRRPDLEFHAQIASAFCGSSQGSSLAAPAYDSQYNPLWRGELNRNQTARRIFTADNGTQSGEQPGISETYTRFNFERLLARGGIQGVTALAVDTINQHIRSASTTIVPRQTFVLRPTVVVCWEWIKLPVGTVAAGFLFLLAVVWRGAGRGADEVLWKASSLPLLYHAQMHDRTKTARPAPSLVDEERTEYDVDANGRRAVPVKISGMEKLAERTRTELRIDGTTGELGLVCAGMRKPGEVRSR